MRYCRHWRIAIATSGLLLGVSSPARAQKVELSPVEFSIGVTINTLLTDLNAPPHCLRLLLPCSHGEAERFSGFGLNLGVARTLGKHLAIAGEVSAFRPDWDVWEPPTGLGRASAWVTSFVVGPRASTEFLLYGPSHGRFFVHALVGGQTSSVGSIRPTLVIGTGAEGGLYRASRRAARGPSRPLFIRWSVDYRISPGDGRSFSGVRIAVSLMVGPRLN
jgi:hypothetical protein